MQQKLNYILTDFVLRALLLRDWAVSLWSLFSSSSEFKKHRDGYWRLTAKRSKNELKKKKVHQCSELETESLNKLGQRPLLLVRGRWHRARPAPPILLRRRHCWRIRRR